MTMKPSPRALERESMPSKTAAKIRSDLFISLLLGIPAEMLPLFSEPGEQLASSAAVGIGRALYYRHNLVFLVKTFHEANPTRAFLGPRWAHFVMSNEYASPARTETSLAIPLHKIRASSTALGMTRRANPR